MGLTGAVTLDAGGDPDAVFIFQAGSTLTTASSSSVVLLNDAQACNVFWQVGSSATFGTSTRLRGNVLAHTSITANTNATFEGRLLAQNGAVTLDSNVITRPGCETKQPGDGGETTPPGGGSTTPPGGGTTPPDTGTDTDNTPPGTGAGDGTAPSRDDTGATAADTSGGANGSSDILPGTGAPASAWLMAGVGLILAGSLALRVARVRPRHRL
jgi:hypothetical protein